MLVSVKKPGNYIAVIQYYHDAEKANFLNVYIRSRTGIQRGKAWLYKCKYVHLKEIFEASFVTFTNNEEEFEGMERTISLNIYAYYIYW